MRKYKLVKEPFIKRLNKEHIYYEIAKEYDEIGYMNKRTGHEIFNLYEDGYSVGIHRTGFTPVTENFINETFNNGSINNGDNNAGGSGGDTNIENLVSFFNHPIELIGQIKVANKHKNSEGSIIVKIPSSYIGKKEGEVKPIYFNDNGFNRLLPEFIYGIVPVDENYVCGNIIRNPNYSDIHTYDNEGLIYDFNVDVPLHKK